MKLALRFAAAIFQVPADVFLSVAPMIAPLPQSLGEVAHRRAVDQLLDPESHVWRLENGESILDYEAELNDATVVNAKMASCDPTGIDGIDIVDQETGEAIPRPSTYGEVTTLGARQLFSLMNMGCVQSSATKSTTEDNEIVFMDLGSGSGRLVMQAYMELPRVSRAIGIELALTRHRQSKDAWERLQEPALLLRRKSLRYNQNNNLLERFKVIVDGGGSKTPSITSSDEEDNYENDIMMPPATLELIEGDFLEHHHKDLFAQATHIYISSLCFSDPMMLRLARLLQSGAPNLKCVATLRPFPIEFEKKGILNRITYDVVTKVFGLIHSEETVEMTWTKQFNRGALVHMYTKPPPS